MMCFYLVLSVGVLKSTHFCMGREASVAFFFADTEKCICEKLSLPDSDCCDDEHALFRIDNDQKVSTAFAISLPAFIKLEELYSHSLLADAGEQKQASIIPNQSPPAIPIYKVNCSFVFYDDEDLVS